MLCINFSYSIHGTKMTSFLQVLLAGVVSDFFEIWKWHILLEMMSFLQVLVDGVNTIVFNVAKWHIFVEHAVFW